jgi:hypothetical protein
VSRFRAKRSKIHREVSSNDFQGSHYAAGSPAAEDSARDEDSETAGGNQNTAFANPVAQMSGMVFMAGKWEGCPASDLELGDVVWIARHGSQLDRAIAREDLMRRQRAAKQRRSQNHEQRIANT